MLGILVNAWDECVSCVVGDEKERWAATMCNVMYVCLLPAFV